MMRVWAVLIILILTLAGCSYLRVQKMDIEQGNVMTEDMISRLRPGMTEKQVKEIMGAPVLKNTFNDDRMDYVYTFKPSYGTETAKRVTLMLQHGRLKEIKTS